MSLFTYLALMIISTALSWGAWVMVVISINPVSADFFGFLLFYCSLSVALTGTFALIGFFCRTIFAQHEEVLYRVLISFRQGLFFSLLIDGFLVMQHARLLTWYNAAFLIIALTLAEFFMISRRSVRV